MCMLAELNGWVKDSKFQGKQKVVWVELGGVTDWILLSEHVAYMYAIFTNKL